MVTCLACNGHAWGRLCWSCRDVLYPHPAGFPPPITADGHFSRARLDSLAHTDRAALERRRRRNNWRSPGDVLGRRTA